MSSVAAVFRSTIILMALCCCAVPSHADPIRVTAGVVNAGFNALGTPLNAEDLQLVGAGFSIGSSLEDEEAFVTLASVPTLADGASIDLSGTLFVGDPVGGEVNGAFALVTAPFTMSFAASPTRLSCSGTGFLTECAAIAPFTFAADLTVTSFGGSPVPQHLIGSGTVEGRLFRSGSFEAAAVTYTFAATPTPEPATVSLLASGAFMTVAAARRRRRASASPSSSHAGG